MIDTTVPRDELTRQGEKVISPLVWGIERRIVFLMLHFHVFLLALAAYRNPVTAMRILAKWIEKKQAILGKMPVHRYVKADGRYFWSLVAPGWPSPGFRIFMENELNRVRPFRQQKPALQTAIIAITSKCGLRCEHCFEWENLDGRETLKFDAIKAILRKFQKFGILQVQLSGGEPLNRFEEMCELLRTAEPETDFWMLTSGFGLTEKKALKMKEAGLNGVVISLDHWNAAEHNRFRRNDKSFDWVQKAARNSRRAGLVVALSVCATREFTTRDNLWRYLHLAKNMGAGFVRILEARAVGRYSGKDVQLDDAHIAILNEFYLAVNGQAAFRDMPIVMYPGYHQRAFGCFGAGNRYLYVDANGDFHACPFCQTVAGNVLEDTIEASIAKMQQSGCHAFASRLIE